MRPGASASTVGATVTSLALRRYPYCSDTRLAAVAGGFEAAGTDLIVADALVVEEAVGGFCVGQVLTGGAGLIRGSDPYARRDGPGGD